jgi:hypothetical protein
MNHDPKCPDSDRPPIPRAFRGLGVQADGYIYDEINREFGVNDADCERWERRLGLLRPGLARIFLSTDEYNPSGDRKTYDWNTPQMQWQLRNLSVLKAAGAQVNLCMGPWTNKVMRGPDTEHLAVDLVEYLVRERGCEHLRWLTLFNEPDAFYTTGSELSRELVARGFGQRYPFEDYLEKHRRALDLLEARGLAGQIKLVVGDMAWPAEQRQEWLERLAEAFTGRDVCYSFHHYGPDETQYDAFFTHAESIQFRPPPLAEEIRRYRETVGGDAELICWEFSLTAWSSGTFTTGIGSRGEDHAGTFSMAVGHAKKVLTMLGEGIDGMCHWCAGDMFFHSRQAPMDYGLWRYKWEAWTPRPVYFYFAALLETIRPGCHIRRIDGLPVSVVGVRLGEDNAGYSQTLVLLNHGREAVSVELPFPGPGQRLRVSPERLPRQPDIPSRQTAVHELPLRDWQSLAEGGHPIHLDPGELTVITSKTTGPETGLRCPHAP